MRICSSCNAPNSEDKEFCSNCGKPLSTGNHSITRTEIVKNRKSKKPILLLLALVVALVAISFSYMSMKGKYGEEAVSNRFVEAVVKQDTSVLKEMGCSSNNVGELF